MQEGLERSALRLREVGSLSRYTIPVALIGRLALDGRRHGQGLDSTLLADGLQKVIRASEALAVYTVIVDAKDEQAGAFYEQLGFIPLSDARHRLLCPIATVERWVGD